MRELKWIPDTFLFTVFGGAFASMLVVLICEISKYFENRESAETFFFSHLYYLYGQLQIILKNIEFLSAHKEQIHKDALTQLIYNSEAEMNTIYYADYAPYKSTNTILTEKSKYESEVFPIIQCVFCKHFLQKSANHFCRLVQLHFVGKCNGFCRPDVSRQLTITDI